MDKKIASFLFTEIVKQYKNQSALIQQMKSIVLVDTNFIWVEIITFTYQVIVIKVQTVALISQILHILSKW